MTDPTELAAAIRRTVTGPMWHGPSIKEAVEGVNYVAANSRPVSGAHSIWEIALHISSWAEIVRTRLGPAIQRDPVRSRDWPAVPNPSPSTWRLTTERIAASYDELANEVRYVDDFRRLVPGRDYTVETMLRGVVEHGAYHAGQIVLLKKALLKR